MSEDQSGDKTGKIEIVSLSLPNAEVKALYHHCLVDIYCIYYLFWFYILFSKAQITAQFIQPFY